MDDVSESLISPKLLQDLLNLEKDFKYNCSLLKIKDSEIERCNAAYIDLQTVMQNNQVDIVTLQVQQTRLQQRHDALERQLVQEKLENQRLKADSCRLVDTLQEQEAQQRLDYSRQETEVQRKHRQMMQDRQDEYTRQIQELQDRATEKQLRIDDLQSKLETQTKNYDEMKRDEEESSTNHQGTILGYQEQITALKESRDRSAQDLVCVRREWNNISSQKDQFKKQVEMNSSKMKDLLEDQNRLSSENGRLLLALSESEKENKYSRGEVGHLKSLLNSPNCSLPAHNHLLKQNGILRELVKSMKKSPSEGATPQHQTPHSILKTTNAYCTSFVKSDSNTKDHRVNYGNVPVVTFAGMPTHSLGECQEPHTKWWKEDNVYDPEVVGTQCEDTATTRKIAKLEHLVELLKLKLVN